MKKQNTIEAAPSLAIDSFVKVGKHKYKIIDEEIKDGDFVFNPPTGKIDYCVAAFNDGSLCIQFNSKSERGLRAIFSKKHFKKAIKQ